MSSKHGLVFKTVTIRNFLSYGNNVTIFDLSNTGATLIVGRDLDTQASGTGANGVGKTALLNAVSFGLYDKPISDISKDNLINNINKNNMVVTVEFEKNGVPYRIERYRKMKDSKNHKSGTYVILYENGKDITPDSIANTNDLLECIIGFSYEIFVTIVVFAANKPSFMSLPLKQQVEMVEKLFCYDVLTLKAEKLKDLIKDDKQELALTEQKLVMLEQEHQRKNQQVSDAIKRAEQWDLSHAQRLQELHSQRDVYADVDTDHQYQLITNLTELQSSRDTITRDMNDINDFISKTEAWDAQHNSKLELLKKDYERIETLEGFDFDWQQSLLIKAGDVQQQIQSLTRTKNQINTDLNNTNDALAAIQKELDHLSDHTCPYCEQHYGNVEEKIQEKTCDKQELDDNAGALSTQIVSLNSELDALNNEQQTLLQDLLVKSEAELVSLKSDLERLKQKVKTIETETNPFCSDPSELSMSKTLKDSYVEKMDEITLKIKEINSQLLVKSHSELAVLKEKQHNINDQIQREEVAINPHQETIDSMNSIDLEPLNYDDVNMIKKRMDHREFLKKILTKRDSFVRKALLNNHLPYLNSRLQQYLQDLGLNFKVEFTPELTASISKLGRPYDYGNLSNGQQSRVNLALSFAFRDVLQKMHSKVNLCMLDEALDVGLDGVGVQVAAKMLKHQAKEQKLSLYVISHRDEMSSVFEKTLTIEMEKGFSYLADQRKREIIS